MYEQIEDLMKLTDDKANVIIIGNFNASVGEQDNSTNCLGKFGHGKQNERGTRLVQFCEQLELTISNTFFQGQNDEDTLGKHQEILEELK